MSFADVSWNICVEIVGIAIFKFPFLERKLLLWNACFMVAIIVEVSGALLSRVMNYCNLTAYDSLCESDFAYEVM